MSEGLDPISPACDESGGRTLDQIVVARFHPQRSADYVNLVYSIESEPIHAFDRNRTVVPIKRDPF